MAGSLRRMWLGCSMPGCRSARSPPVSVARCARSATGSSRRVWRHRRGDITTPSSHYSPTPAGCVSSTTTWTVRWATSRTKSASTGRRFAGVGRGRLRRTSLAADRRPADASPEWLRARVADGATHRQIAGELGVGPTTAADALCSAGIKTDRRRLRFPALHDGDWLRQQYAEHGGDLAAVAAVLGCSTSAVRQAAHPTRDHPATSPARPAPRRCRLAARPTSPASQPGRHRRRARVIGGDGRSCARTVSDREPFADQAGAA